MFNNDISIDLGTATVLVYIKNKGIVLREPTVIAVNTKTNEVCAVGKDALAMLGRTPPHIQAVRPLIDGVISNLTLTQEMIKHFFSKIFSRTIGEPHIPNPADIIVSHRFAKLVKALSAKFQYVIFDAPPVGTFIDAAEIASLTDGALFVVREDFTKREEALNAIAQLKKSEKVKLIGTVMNYCETETSEYYYSYYTKDGKKVKKGSDDQGTSKKGIFTNRANV